MTQTDWIPVSERLPEKNGRKMSAVFGLTDKGGRVIVYYFPEHFKTLEWEDWDDYKQEDYPYTEEDAEKGIVWLRPGWYKETSCDRCEDYSFSPVTVTHWMPIPPKPKPNP